MIQSKQRLTSLIEKINRSFPDENDLKGFAGISKKMIVDVLIESDTIINNLQPFDSQFQTIILKRQLADLFNEIDKEFNEIFDKIKTDKFEHILVLISKLRYAVRETYFIFSTDPPIRTEADILKAKEELNSLNNSIEESKKIIPALDTLNETTVKAVEDITKEINIKKESILNTISVADVEIQSIKDSKFVEINKFYDEAKLSNDSVKLIHEDLMLKQTTALSNEQKMEDLLAKCSSNETLIEAVKKSTALMQSEILGFKNDIASNTIEYVALNSKSKTLQADSLSLYEKIAGKKDESGKQIKGYVQEIEDFKKESGDYLIDQKGKYSTQFKEIEGLLPGATTVGLAEAYQIQKKSYERPLFLWSCCFIGVIVLMTAFGVTLIILQFQKPTELTFQEAIITFLKDLPFFIPTIWLAAYASKQQSQYKRLQQEYAFKETNAKSFHGHKMQIEELMKDGKTDSELLLKLVQQLVVITGQNPSHTLENTSHEDSHPLMKALEKFFKKKAADDSEKKKVAE